MVSMSDQSDKHCYHITSRAFVSHFYAELYQDVIEKSDGSSSSETILKVTCQDVPVCVCITIDKYNGKHQLHNVHLHKYSPYLRHSPIVQCMLRCALKLASILFEDSTHHFELIDLLRIRNPYKRTEEYVSVSDLMFLIQGKTWYEMVLNLSQKQMRGLHVAYQKVFVQKPAFKDFVFELCPEEYANFSDIHKIYKATQSWKDFFQDLFLAFGYKPFMTLGEMKKQVLGFITGEAMTFYGTQWKISKHLVSTYEELEIREIAVKDYCLHREYSFEEEMTCRKPYERRPDIVVIPKEAADI